MYPVIFKIGRFTIQGYGLMIGIGVIAALAMALYRAKKRGLNEDHIFDIAIYGVIGGIIGAKLMFIIVEVPYIIKNPILIKDFILGGFVVYGGILGGALTAFIYCKRKRIEFIKYFDFLSPSIALAQGFGRFGCFLAGCCYGKVTTGPFGVNFKNSFIAPHDIKLHPTQIYSSLGDFAIALILLYYGSREREDGRIGGLYLILYSIGRFFLEFLRDDPRGSVGILSTSQFICIFVLALGIGIFNMRKIKSVLFHKSTV